MFYSALEGRRMEATGSHTSDKASLEQSLLLTHFPIVSSAPACKHSLARVVPLEATQILGLVGSVLPSSRILSSHSQGPWQKRIDAKKATTLTFLISNLRHVFSSSIIWTM